MENEKTFGEVNEINGELIKRQIRQQPAQCVQKHCIMLILSQKHLEKRTHRSEAKSIQGPKWHSQENCGRRSGWMVGLSKERSRNMAGKNKGTKTQGGTGHMLNLK